MKLFFKEKKYHVINLSSVRFVHHTDDIEEAKEKATYYAETSGHEHQVLERKFTASQARIIEVSES